MIDTTRIKELRQEVGDEDFHEVVELFCAEVEEVLESLDAAKLQDLPEHIHFLKGSALNLGFQGFGDFCQQAESRLRSNPTHPIGIDDLRNAYFSSKTKLDEILSPL